MKKFVYSLIVQLEPGDQILSVNGEDVKDAPRDHVIQLVRNCETSVAVIVCQPQLSYTTNGRKSTLLSPAKKHKLKTRPIRVRFAESVCVNGSPLFPVSSFIFFFFLFTPFSVTRETRHRVCVFQSRDKFYLIFFFFFFCSFCYHQPTLFLVCSLLPFH